MPWKPWPDELRERYLQQGPDDSRFFDAWSGLARDIERSGLPHAETIAARVLGVTTDAWEKEAYAQLTPELKHRVDVARELSARRKERYRQFDRDVEAWARECGLPYGEAAGRS